MAGLTHYEALSPPHLHWTPIISSVDGLQLHTPDSAMPLDYRITLGDDDAFIQDSLKWSCSTVVLWLGKYFVYELELQLCDGRPYTPNLHTHKLVIPVRISNIMVCGHANCTQLIVVNWLVDVLYPLTDYFLLFASIKKKKPTATQTEYTFVKTKLQGATKKQTHCQSLIQVINHIRLFLLVLTTRAVLLLTHISMST